MVDFLGHTNNSGSLFAPSCRLTFFAPAGSLAKSPSLPAGFSAYVLLAILGAKAARLRAAKAVLLAIADMFNQGVGVVGAGVEIGWYLEDIGAG